MNALSVLLLAFFVLCSFPRAFALPGDLDVSFGTGGKVVTPVGTGEDRGHAVGRQSDGKIVVGGYSHNGSNKDFAVLRYNVDGTLDTGFGTNGKVTTDFGGTQDEINALVVQSDGRIFVAGQTYNAGNNTSNFALARYNDDGTPDTSFGVTGTGRIIPAVGTATSTTKANGMALQPDGKVVIVGTGSMGSGRMSFALLRYQSDGTLDNGFGTGGVVFIDFSGDHCFGFDVLVQPDGRIVTVGYHTGFQIGGAVIGRCESNGSLDTSFGTNGKATTSGSGLNGMSQPYTVALQADGKIVLGGISPGNDFALWRSNANGMADASFSNTTVPGLVVTGVGTSQDLVYDVAIQPDGRIVAAGYSYNANTGSNDFAVVRYETNGALDTSFQSTGKVTTTFSGGVSTARGLLIAPDGRIIAAGHARNGTNDDFAMVRYEGIGSLATMLPVHGSRTNDSTPQTGGLATTGFTVTVYVDGSSAGTTTADGSGNWSFTPSSPLADGVHTVAATETDGFGSTSALSNTVSFTVDTAAPAPPVIGAPAEASLVNSAWPMISGTAEVGATVTVQIDGIAVGTAVAGLAGTWALSPGSALTNGPHTGRALATDAAGNNGGFSSLVSFSTFAALFGGPGTLDTSLGGTGKVITPVGTGEDRGHALGRQSDGKFVVGGYSHNGSNKDFAVVRYNVDGTLDTSFGTNGKVTTDFGGTQDEINALVVQADGRIFVAGQTYNAGNNTSNFALARYNADGTPDTTFGVTGTGRIMPSIGAATSTTKANGMALQPDGKVVIVGTGSKGSGRMSFALLRYHSDGTLDNGFGTGGLVFIDFSGDHCFGFDVLVQPDGRIVTVGYHSGFQIGGAVIGRCLPDGSLDASFGTNGKATTSGSGLNGMSQPYTVALQADGKIMLGGISPGNDFALWRSNANGTADASFSNTTVPGLVVTGVGTSQDLVYDVAIQPDGRIVAAGYSYNANTNSNDFAVVRFNTNGTLDTSFQGSGKVTTTFSGGVSTARGVLIAPDGRIIAAGHARNGVNDDFALVRYFGTDQPPIVTTGDATGIVRAGAVLNGAVNPNSLATMAYFEYGTTTGYGSTSSSVNLGNGYLASPTAITIGGLTDNTLYHYRLVATNAAGTTYGEDTTFTTAPNPPLAFTGDAANVSASGATLVGVVLPTGRDTTAYFEYGLSTAYGMQTGSQLVPATSIIMDVFEPVAGLVAGATYHFRVVAVNAGSPIPITGLDKTFVAQAPAPIVTLAAALPLGNTGATLNGTVNANGAGTQVFFDYGTDGITFPNSVTATPEIVTGTSVMPVTGAITNLAQGVTYHYRLRAVSAGGTTLSSPLTFQMDLLLGLNWDFPDPPPPTEGFLLVNLTPAGILHGWRFLGEQQWRVSGVASGGLATGNRSIEFRPVPGYLHPLPQTVSVVSGQPATVVTEDYFVTPTAGTGILNVTLKPDGITTGPDRAQWRLSGEDDTHWRDSGDEETNLPPGNYLIECRAVPGRATPLPVNVSVSNGITSAPVITYFLPDSPTGTAPTVLAFETVSTDMSKPYAFAGQLRSHLGSATGFVVKERVVATAAHVVWDDFNLVAVQGLQWLFQRHRGLNEPEPILPRGFYTFTGYTGQREMEDTPGEFSPQSQHLDVAALYFNESAGRGGFSGYLASDLSNNEFLLSSANKVLVGYPIDGIPAASQGRMHATTPANIAFASAFGRTYTTTAIRSSGGNSGGPLCVQFNGGSYFPAAIYLGGNNQTVVRVIDSQVVDMFNRAVASGNGGAGNSSGGITQTDVTHIPSTDAGAVKVLIEPAAARAVTDSFGNVLARWKLYQGDPTDNDKFRLSDTALGNLRPGTYVLQMSTIPGFDVPAQGQVMVSAGQQTTLTYTYNTPQESWRQLHFGSTVNSGHGADAFDFDGDGFSNAAEYAAGTNPTLASDRMLAYNPQRSGSSFSVSIEGRSGRTYFLERSINLSSWGTVASQGPLSYDATVTLTDATTPGAAGFYRIRVTGPAN